MFLAQLRSRVDEGDRWHHDRDRARPVRYRASARQEPGGEDATRPVGWGRAEGGCAGERPLPYAWRRTDRYEPPDFARFFPDDPEGGRALDQLWGDEGRDKRPAAEILPIVRRGLRRTTAGRDEILAWIGGRFVWDASPQDPDAIEILYHATDFRGPVVNYPRIPLDLLRTHEGRSPKPPAILHALVDWCMHVENTMDWYWAGWYRADASSGAPRIPQALSRLGRRGDAGNGRWWWRST